jgi:hypothetical protein
MFDGPSCVFFRMRVGICGLAHQMNRVTILALLQGMILNELIPMPSLIRRQDAGPFAQRTNTVEGGQDRRTNKLGPVGNMAHRLKKRFIDLERDDLVFFVDGHGVGLPTQ